MRRAERPAPRRMTPRFVVRAVVRITARRAADEMDVINNIGIQGLTFASCTQF
jgi:hypothetical protein